MKYILAEDGQTPVPCDDTIEWGRWFESGKRQVGDSTIGNVRISTVFLGLDHRFMGGGPPILWETMIFGGWLDGYQTRASSHAQALKDHIEAVMEVRHSRRPWRQLCFAFKRITSHILKR